MAVSQLTAERISELRRHAATVAHVPGDVIEVGVWRGGSARVLCMAFPDRTVHLFDTFAGMPKPSAIDSHRQGDFRNTSQDVVRESLKPLVNYEIHAGVFPQTAAEVEGETFAFAHVDCDLYESTKAALEFIWPRLGLGGLIVLDDYKSAFCAGATRAIDEFRDSKELEFFGDSPKFAATMRKVCKLALAEN